MITENSGWKLFNRTLDRCAEAGRWLALPVSLLLFAQWPLRELVQHGSREANDLAQLLFALYVVMAVNFTSRRRLHLASDLFARRYPERWRRRVELAGSLLMTLPWAVFLLWASLPVAFLSLRQLEAFPETYNPGYFIIKAAVLLLACVELLHALASAVHAVRDEG